MGGGIDREVVELFTDISGTAEECLIQPNSAGINPGRDMCKGRRYKAKKPVTRIYSRRREWVGVDEKIGTLFGHLHIWTYAAAWTAEQP